MVNAIFTLEQIEDSSGCHPDIYNAESLINSGCSAAILYGSTPGFDGFFFLNTVFMID